MSMSVDDCFVPAALNNVNTPLLITDSGLKILWMNQDMKQQQQGGFEIGKTLDDLFPDQKAALTQITSRDLGAGRLTLSLLHTSFEARVSVFTQTDGRLLWNFVKHQTPSDMDLNEVLLKQQKIFRTMSRAAQKKTSEIYNQLSVFTSAGATLSEQEREAEQHKQRHTLQAIARGCYEFERLFINAGQLYPSGLECLAQGMKTISLAPYLSELIQQLKGASRYPDSKITLEILDPQLLVQIEPESFEIALLNLLARAYDVSTPEGKIQVTLRKKTTHTALITIQDEGIGSARAADDDLPSRISHMPDSMDVEGLIKHSLLPISKSIIQRQGGRVIRIDSKNTGSIVSIELNLATPERLEPMVRSRDRSLENKLSTFFILLATSCGFDLL